VRFYRINPQSAFTGIPGNGLVPSLQGVLAAKTPRVDDVSGVVVCEQELLAVKQAAHKLTAIISFIGFMRETFVKPKKE
jgi:hypothetical protein